MGRASDTLIPLNVPGPGDVVALRNWSDGRTARVRRIKGSPTAALWLRYRSGNVAYSGNFATPFAALEFADMFVWEPERFVVRPAETGGRI